jgi:hypothetical protein
MKKIIFLIWSAVIILFLSMYFLFTLFTSAIYEEEFETRLSEGVTE